jgi:hypothetical protein
LVNTTLMDRWPHNFIQVSLVVLLAICEILAFQQVQTLSLWFFFIGCTALVGGVIVRRTSRLMTLDDFAPSAPFQHFGAFRIAYDIRRSRYYTLIGLSLIVLSLLYDWLNSLLRDHLSSFAFLLPWVLLSYSVIILYFQIAPFYAKNIQKEILAPIHATTDLTKSPEGILRYKKNVLLNEGDEKLDRTIEPQSYQSLEPVNAYSHLSFKYLLGTIVCSNVVLVFFFFLFLRKRRK